MIIALYIAAAVIMAVGSLYFAWRNRDFRKFLAGGSSCHRAFCSISISPMFRCLCWGQVLSKHLRSAVAAPSSISSSSCSVSILASSASQRLERMPSHVCKRLLFFMGLPLLLGSWAGPAATPPALGVGMFSMSHNCPRRLCCKKNGESRLPG